MNMDFLKVNAKAIVGFVAGLIINAITAVVNGEVPWPTSLKEWAQYLGTALLGGILVWATGNKLTKPQVVKGAAELGLNVAGQVAEKAVVQASDTAKAVVAEAATRLPEPARDLVNNTAGVVGMAVEEVLRNYRPGR